MDKMTITTLKISARVLAKIIMILYLVGPIVLSCTVTKLFPTEPGFDQSSLEGH